jgi:dihydroxy-acid dehydratase
MPACLMAMARLNRPSIFVYGGSIKPGANRTDVVSVFEAVGKHSEGSLSDIELLDIESSAIPGPG